MNSVKIIMGIKFDADDDIPNFGSIYARKLNNNGVNDYGLNETDIDKLDLLTNADYGSTALCDDTGNLYTKRKTGWAKFGG